MDASWTRKTLPASPGMIRCGRPRRELAGEVEERILEAAGKCFSSEASRARASRRSQRSRAPESRRSMRDTPARRRCSPPWWRARCEPTQALSASPRWAQRSSSAWRQSLPSSSGGFSSPESIGLMRAVVAEARRFPIWRSASNGRRAISGSSSVARLLGEVAQSGEMGAWPAFAPDRLSGTARRFMDVIVFPMAMRALFGEDLSSLRAEIEPHVKQAVAFFFGACRHAPPASDGHDQLTVSERADR